jgi:DNA-binding NarL/FixJ family response regulator
LRRVSRFAVADADFLVVSVSPDEKSLARLTAAERLVLNLVLAGLTDAEIARKRTVSRRTISKQVASILQKLEVASRAELGAKIV